MKNRRTKQISNQWFYRLYAIYGTGFLLLCTGIVVSCLKDFYIRILVPAALCLMAVLLFFFVLSVKRGVLRIFDACNNALSQAISGTVPQPQCEETELALFQSNLNRFISIKDREAQDAVQQKKAIETLLTDISHQTKTPLSNILVYSQLLAERSRENGELIQKLLIQSEKLRFLIEALMKMARLENGIIRCVLEKASLRELLVQVVGDFYKKAQEKKLDVKLDCPEESPAFFDRKWLREAIGNILDNAIKYTPCGGQVQIRVIPYEMFSEIRISDTGIGIEEEEIPKIFGRFYRGREVSSEEGFGVGLYLARELVTAQRGYIKVESCRGRGSSFRVFVPAVSQK